MTPLLSILIPAVPSRMLKAAALYSDLLMQAAGHNVEILMLTDNKVRTTGEKRQALVDLAQGTYIAFVDDDDGVAEDYVESVLAGCLAEWDVVTFPTSTSLNGGPRVIGHHSLLFPNEEYNPAGFKRKPWLCHAWRRALAWKTKFPALRYGEDPPWCAAMAAKAKTEVLVSDTPLYFYNFSAAGTEAK